MKEQLREEILTILIQSNFHAKFGLGETAWEISNFEKRAALWFRDTWKENAIISEQVGFIMEAINRQKGCTIFDRCAEQLGGISKWPRPM